MRHVPGVVAAVLVAVLAAQALPDRGRLATGVAAADAERWDEAVEAFLGAPRPSAAALYDAGTVAFAQGDVPRALARWRAAHEQAPRNDDVAHDVALARSAIDGAVEPVGPARGWMEVVTAEEVGALAILLAALGSWLARRRVRHGDPIDGWTAAVLLAAGGALGLVAADGARARLHEPVAVATVEAIARDAPTLEGSVRHALAAGSELRALRASGAFVLVEDGTGRRGWVRVEALEIPDPGRFGGNAAPPEGVRLPSQEPP